MPSETYHAVFVDDDRDFLSSMRMSVTARLDGVLNGVDLETHFLNGPFEALELTRELAENKEQIAVIVSDQQMPDLTGIQLLEKLKNVAPKAIRVLLTGYASLDSAKYAINNDILDHYVSKPIEDYDNFGLVIRNALKTVSLRTDKERAEQEIQRYITQLEENNRIIKGMHLAAERIAYFAQGFRKLDFDEVIELIMTKVPEVFRAKYASLFLVDEEKGELQAVKSNHFTEKFSHPLDAEINTPMMAALRENKVIVLPLAKNSLYKLLGHRHLGSSCVIIPFVISEGIAPSLLPGEKGGIRGVLNLGHVEGMGNLEIVHYAATLVQNILGINILNARLYRRTQDLALYDGLTGLYNRHVFMEFLKKGCDSSDRSSLPVQLGILDLDNFKAINDAHGHLVGDAVLSELGRLLRQESRTGEVVGRFGGEEFTWLSSANQGEVTHSPFERVRKLIEDTDFPDALRITMSMGVACYQPNSRESAESLIRRADQALYRAKSLGKNRIEVALPYDHR